MPAYPKPQKQPKERKPWGGAYTPAPKLRDRADAGIPASGVKPLVRGTYGGGTLAAEPKTKPKRNRTLLDMAKGRRCLLLAVEGCQGASGLTTVAAHSNSSQHGKGRARKADDSYSVWACGPCHAWLDTSGSPRAEKERAFAGAHFRQVLRWREIAKDPTEQRYFRDAAEWALNEVGDVTPNWPAQG